MELTGERFNKVANRYIEKGLDSEERDLTPGMVKKVLPGFETATLISLIVECAGILNSRMNDQASIEGQQAIAAWIKLLRGEDLSFPELSRVAKIADADVEKVEEVVNRLKEVSEDTHQPGS